MGLSLRLFRVSCEEIFTAEATEFAEFGEVLNQELIYSAASEVLGVRLECVNGSRLAAFTVCSLRALTGRC
jgi:hypothetical protein